MWSHLSGYAGHLLGDGHVVPADIDRASMYLLLPPCWGTIEPGHRHVEARGSLVPLSASAILNFRIIFPPRRPARSVLGPSGWCLRHAPTQPAPSGRPPTGPSPAPRPAWHRAHGLRRCCCRISCRHVSFDGLGCFGPGAGGGMCGAGTEVPAPLHFQTKAVSHVAVWFGWRWYRPPDGTGEWTYPTPPQSRD